jgi:hypothetical protein
MYNGGGRVESIPTLNPNHLFIRISHSLINLLNRQGCYKKFIIIIMITNLSQKTNDIYIVDF